MRTDKYFRERGRRADRAITLRILDRAGKGNPPMDGDELPPEEQSRLVARKVARKSNRMSKRRWLEFCKLHLRQLPRKMGL
jgi:hypothetical protein